MKRTFFLFAAFICLGGSAFADTLDYWHVFYNDALVLQCNSVSENPEISLRLDDISEGDSLFVRYGDDTPCSNCIFSILVRDEERRIIGMASTDKFWGKIGFDLQKVVGKIGKGRAPVFHLFYAEHSSDPLQPAPRRSRILTVRLE